MINAYIILVFHFLIYGIPPLLIASGIQKFQSMSFLYAYFGFLFVFTQLFAVFYAIQISENLIITGGNIAYCSLILLTFMIAILNNDPAVVRNLILIEILLNFFLFFLYYLLYTILLNSDVSIINLYNIFPEIFRTTILVNIVSLILFIIEMIVLFSLLEVLKKHFNSTTLLFLFFIVVFIGILCLDGVLFPIIINFSEPGLGTEISGGVLGKFILSLGYSPFLIMFLIIYREHLHDYLKDEFRVRYTLVPPKKKLIKDLETIGRSLELSEEKYYDAYNRVLFYRDLFTHDMSNIIQNISLYNHLSKKNKNNERTVDSAMDDEMDEILEQQIISAKRLIKNIRKLSDIDKETPELDEKSIETFIGSAIKNVQDSFQDKEIKITIEPFDTSFKVFANDFLYNVFENILNNSISYNEREIIKITIKVSKCKIKEEDFIKLEFKDNGIGIEDEFKEKIFQKGYQKHKGDKGMGIGLSLVTKILELYNGKIWVEDRIKGEYSQGSNFVVIIPEA